MECRIRAVERKASRGTKDARMPAKSPPPPAPKPARRCRFEHTVKPTLRSELHPLSLGEQLRYWKVQLDGASVVDLPTYRPRPAEGSSTGAAYPFDVPRHVATRFTALVGQHDV